MEDTQEELIMRLCERLPKKVWIWLEEEYGFDCAGDMIEFLENGNKT